MFLKGRDGETAARDFVLPRRVARRAGEVESLRVHVDVEFPVGLGKRSVHVAVFHAFSAAAPKMARAACVPLRLAYVLGDIR